MGNMSALWGKVGAMGLSGAVYTQLSDVEQEWNGLLTYDRQVKCRDEWTRLVRPVLLETRARWSS